MEESIVIKKEAQDKMIEGNQYFIYPSSMRSTPLKMSDMDNGIGGFHSVESLEKHSSVSWVHTKLNEKIEFIHYCFDEDGEKDHLRAELEKEGLVDIRLTKKVDNLTIDDFVENGFAIVSSREIKVIQKLFNGEK